jgi:hypothetical protein
MDRVFKFTPQLWRLSLESLIDTTSFSRDLRSLAYCSLCCHLSRHHYLFRMSHAKKNKWIHTKSVDALIKSNYIDGTTWIISWNKPALPLVYRGGGPSEDSSKCGTIKTVCRGGSPSEDNSKCSTIKTVFREGEPSDDGSKCGTIKTVFRGGGPSEDNSKCGTIKTVYRGGGPSEDNSKCGTIKTVFREGGPSDDNSKCGTIKTVCRGGGPSDVDHLSWRWTFRRYLKVWHDKDPLLPTKRWAQTKIL